MSAEPYAALNLATHVADAPTSVAANRRIVERTLGLQPDHLVVMEAAHGREISVVSTYVDPAVAGFDSLVTSEPGIAVAALAADCLLVLLHDADAGIVGAVHAGWIGVRDDVVGATIEQMRLMGARRLVGMIGPGVCGECYPVPPDRVAQVADVVPEAASRTSAGHPSLDLTRGMLAHLGRAGVEASAVGICTVESPRHYSYRRDHVTGRQAGVIVLDDVSAR